MSGIDYPVISVVIPVYNAHEALPKCLNSILHQDYPHWELILVDDGSTDGSCAIADEWATRYSQVRAVHQVNQGQAAARWRGVMESSGEWVTFVDNDDTMIPTALSDLFGCTDTSTDIVLGNGRSLPGEHRAQIPMADFRHLAVRGEGSIGLIWGSLYRRSILSAYAFQVPSNIRTGEDYIFWLRTVFASERPVNVLQKNVYCKGHDSFSSSFQWTADYAAQIHELRRTAIPEHMRDEFMNEMITDRICNLFDIAVRAPRREWATTAFYMDLQHDIQATGYRMPLKKRCFMLLPSRRLRRLYSILSDIRAKLFG